MIKYIEIAIWGGCDFYVPYFMTIVYNKERNRNQSIFFIAMLLSVILNILRVPFLVIEFCNLYLFCHKQFKKGFFRVFVILGFLYLTSFVLYALSVLALLPWQIVINVPRNVFQFFHVFYTMIVFSFLLFNYYHKNIKELRSRKVDVLVMISIIIALLMEIVSFLHVEDNRLINSLDEYTILSVLCIFTILDLFFFIYLIKSSENKIMTLHNQRRIDSLKLQNLMEKEKYFDEMQKYKHDINNHLRTLQYLKKSNPIKMHDYLKDLIGKFDDIETTHRFYSKQPIINAILSEKVNENTQINFNINIQCQEALFINDLDLNIILSNLLDNAIEYVSLHNSISSYVSFKVIEHEEILLIYCENSLDSKWHMNSFKTHKSDKINHGYGIKNIKNVVMKYNGFIKIETIDQKFSISILLKK